MLRHSLLILLIFSSLSAHALMNGFAYPYVNCVSKAQGLSLVVTEESGEFVGRLYGATRRPEVYTCSQVSKESTSVFRCTKGKVLVKKRASVTHNFVKIRDLTMPDGENDIYFSCD